ncbi:hypothetical protein [Roseisalinus antarcticus]|uniref:Anti-sigma factor NepR domain-containing protein n=1 Tax=Roseisalinus antarcticus TaxID=254357 RepID=A0A1Y5RGC8_9RHOB|nr:hypothetical protein [Roseisalinus antarcticus]SLN14030.1 hypothetical protein ROA7023_00105 [Roseisalinus antarcticus]
MKSGETMDERDADKAAISNGLRKAFSPPSAPAPRLEALLGKIAERHGGKGSEGQQASRS